MFVVAYVKFFLKKQGLLDATFFVTDVFSIWKIKFIIAVPLSPLYKVDFFAGARI